MSTFNHEFFYGELLEAAHEGITLEEVYSRSGLGDQWSREDTVLFAGREQVERFEDDLSNGRPSKLVLTASEEIRAILEAAGEPTVMTHVVTPV